MKISLLVVVAFGLVACGAEAPPEDQASPSPPAVGEPGIDEADLASIVFGPDEPPRDTEYQETGSGPVSLEELAAGLNTDVASLNARGFRAAYQTVFPGRRPSGSPPPAANEVQGVASVAVLFEDEETASAFLDTLFPEDQKIPDAEYSEPDVGEESVAVVTEISAQRPRVATITWRRANLYLLLNVFGEYSFEESLEMAKTIDERAIAAAD